MKPIGSLMIFLRVYVKFEILNQTARYNPVCHHNKYQNEILKSPITPLPIPIENWRVFASLCSCTLWNWQMWRPRTKTCWTNSSLTVRFSDSLEGVRIVAVTPQYALSPGFECSWKIIVCGPQTQPRGVLDSELHTKPLGATARWFCLRDGAPECPSNFLSHLDDLLVRRWHLGIKSESIFYSVPGRIGVRAGSRPVPQMFQWLLSGPRLHSKTVFSGGGGSRWGFEVWMLSEPNLVCPSPLLCVSPGLLLTSWVLITPSQPNRYFMCNPPVCGEQDCFRSNQFDLFLCVWCRCNLMHVPVAWNVVGLIPREGTSKYRWRKIRWCDQILQGCIQQ